MKENQWAIVIMVGLAVVVVALLMRKGTKLAPAAAVPNTNQVSTGTSILNTLIKTAGDVTTSIFGGGSGGSSGGYSYTYTESSSRLGGG